MKLLNYYRQYLPTCLERRQADAQSPEQPAKSLMYILEHSLHCNKVSLTVSSMAWAAGGRCAWR